MTQFRNMIRTFKQKKIKKIRYFPLLNKISHKIISKPLKFKVIKIKNISNKNLIKKKIHLISNKRVILLSLIIFNKKKHLLYKYRKIYQNQVILKLKKSQHRKKKKQRKKLTLVQRTFRFLIYLKESRRTKIIQKAKMTLPNSIKSKLP